jgi:MFS family permease
MATDAPVYCVNHPRTETLLRCNKCGRPVCIKCVQLTAVGYRCKQCLNIQQAGYYTAASVDYAIAAMVGLITSIVGGAIAAAIGGFWFFAIFYAPVVGGIIAEIIRRVIQKRRGRYIWLVACGAVIVGGFIGAGLLPLIAALGTGRAGLLLLAVPAGMLSAVFNIGLWIYLVLAVGTVYARLRS